MSTSKNNSLPHVAVLFSRIGPYHFARLKAAGTRLNVTAVESSEVDATYAWAVVAGAEHFARLTLFPEADVAQLSPSLIVSRVAEILGQVHPRAVAISGWSDRCSLAALLWCLSNQVPAIVMSETTAWDDTRRWWKECLKRRLMGLFSAALVGGHPHADYLEALGMPRATISLGYDAVDNDCFWTQAAEARHRRSEISITNSEMQNPAPRKMAGEGLVLKRYFLASARFVEKKNLARLLEAYARYREMVGKAASSKRQAQNAAPQTPPHCDDGSEPWDLVLLGDGPLRASLKALVMRLNLQDSVHMPGFKQYDGLPTYYGHANAFIHASTTEQWGLVVNEAMASGLPVLVSNRCGCAQDLVQEDVNGFTFDPFSIEAITQAMFRLSSLGSHLSAFGAASQRIIADWGTSRFADGLTQAVGFALNQPSRRAGIFDRLLLRLLMMRS